jgi:hypothetical protein
LTDWPPARDPVSVPWRGDAQLTCHFAALYMA